MSDLHCRGCDCLDCCPGFPAQATRVYADKSRIGPRLLRREDREAGLEAQRKYYWQNLAKERERSRKAMAAMRATRRSAAAMVASQDRTPGAEP